MPIIYSCLKFLKRNKLGFIILVFLIILIFFAIKNGTYNLDIFGLVGLNEIQKIKVAFFSHNLQSLSYDEDDINLIFKTFLEMKSIHLNKQNKQIRIIKFQNLYEKTKSLYSEYLNDFDIIYLSFQEIAKEKKLKKLISILIENGYDCDSIQSNSSIRKIQNIFIGYKATYVVICHNSVRLKFLENFRYSNPVKSKSIHGGCYNTVQHMIKKQTYCFLGIHAEMVFEKSIKDFIDMLHSIKKKYQNPTIYILGDTNIRSFQNSFYSNDRQIRELKKEEDFEFLSKFLWSKLFNQHNFQKNLGKRDNKTENEFFIENKKLYDDGDEKSINFIKNVFENYNKNNSTNMQINFLGNENLRQLPPTYKFITFSDKNKRKILNYDYKLISNKQLIYNDLKVFKFGLLDRLICFNPNEKYYENCSINEKIVNYFFVPSLRIADHMPISGIFEIKVDKQ